MHENDTDTVAIDKLKPAPYNPRKDLKPTDPEYQAIARSMDTFGVTQDPIWNKRTGHIVGGHQRVKILKDRGVTKVRVVVVDLPLPEEKALNIAMNRIAGQWDNRMLISALEELRGRNKLEVTGFSTAQLEQLKALQVTQDARLAKRTSDPDEVPPVLPDPITKLGDIVLLGEHRMICGDATKPEDVARLMGDSPPAGMMWTDPPYGVGYVGGTGLEIANDDAEGLPALLKATWAAVSPALAPGAPFYVAHPAGPLSVPFGASILDAGWRIHETLVWVKDAMVLGHADYHYRHEPIIYGWLPGPGRSGRGKHEGSRWFGGNSETSVFEYPRPRISADHPTMKPVRLVERQVGNSSPPGAVVLDPFLGSGTTMIACERLGRRCFGMELEPRYVDVAVRRWEEFTGKKAKLQRSEAPAVTAARTTTRRQPAPPAKASRTKRGTKR